MNFKKHFFSIATFMLILNNEAAYTKEAEYNDDQHRTTITSHENSEKNNHQESLTETEIEFCNFIQENFQFVTKQTESIEYCLQQIELIVNAGKIKFDTTKTSKEQFLEEIKEIKGIIQFVGELQANQESIVDGLIKASCFNAASIQYLLPIIQKDITQLHAKTFDQQTLENFHNIIPTFQNLNSLADIKNQIKNIIQKNDHDIELLKQASDNIGLTLLNKWYRYLDTKPLPWYGKSTIATVKDITFWSTAALVTYCIGTYIAPSDHEINYGNWNFNTKHLPFKEYIGSCNITDLYKSPGLTPTEQAEIGKNLGFAGIFDLIKRACDNPLVSFVGPVLASQTMPHLKELYKNGSKYYEQGVNYLLKGDTNLLKDSNQIPKTYFNDMIGGDHLEKLARELADYLKNPLRYERAGITPSTGYLLVGPSQTGKSYFAKALKTLIDEEFAGSTETVKFFSITPDLLQWYGGSFEYIFTLARRDAPCILFIDEIDMYGTRRDKNPRNTQELLTSMNGLDTDPSKKVIVIAATNKPEELDFALKQKGRLGTIITFDYPTYECRKQYLEKQLAKKNINLNPEMMDTIAQETDGHTYNMIDDIIRQALQLATYETRPVLEADFETTLDREIRKIKPNTTISTQEKELIAIYQAGQAAARHVLATEQQIVKITIDTVDKPIKSKEGFGFISENKGHQHENIDLLPQSRIKQTRLGNVFTISKTNNHELMSDEDQEKELIALLSGSAALELIKGKTYHEFGKEERARVLKALEDKISQGNPVTDKIRAEAIKQKDILYQQAKELLKNHAALIRTITDTLLQHNTINKKQWAQLVASYPIN